MAAQRRPPQAPGRGALQSATGGGYRPQRQARSQPAPTQTAPAPSAPAAPAAGLPKRYAGMDPGVAAERFKMFKAGQLPGQQGGAGSSAPPMPAGTPAWVSSRQPMLAADAEFIKTGGHAPWTGAPGLQSPGATSPADQPPGIDGAIANLRSQLGMTQAGGAAPSGADPMSMIARLRGNAQMAQANGYPTGDKGGMVGAALATGGQYRGVPGQPGKGPAPMPDFQGLRGQFGPAMQAGAQGAQFGGIPPQLAGNLPTGAAGMTKPFFGDISQMTGQAAGPSGLSGLPATGGLLGGNPYLNLLRNRLGGGPDTSRFI